ncbi:hypothetical protein, partial [Peribacillus frigoritolerans]|uniref:hypothetical protein n=1 Tax=Peribacillus frigoritolerans TaxID=450367 RepID=UPI0020BE9F21
PAESECLKWKSKFYTASKNLRTKGFLCFKTKLIGAGVRDSCRKSGLRGTPAGVPRRLPDDEVEIKVEL